MKALSIQDILKAVVHRGIAILLAVFVVVAATAVYTFVAMPDVYTARTTMYVLNQQSEDTVSYSDLTGSALLINDYRELITSYTVTNAVAQKLGLQNLSAYNITVSARSNTRMIEIAVTGREAYAVVNVANALADAFTDSVVDIMKVENVSVIDKAQLPTSPSGPAREKYIIFAGFATLVLGVLLVVLIELMSTTLKTAQDVESQTGLWVLAQVAQAAGTKKRGGRAS